MGQIAIVEADFEPQCRIGSVIDDPGDDRQRDDPDVVDTGSGPGAALDMGAFERDPNLVCPEDIDGSNVVDFGDLLRILDKWGDCAGCPEDLNGDNVVDFNDLLIILGAWGWCP